MIVSKLNRILGGISVTVVGIITLVVVADVTGRFAFNNPIPGAYELVRTLLVMVVFLGLGYGQFVGAHVSTDMLIKKFSFRARNLIHGLGLILAIVIISIVGYSAILKAIEATATGEYSVGLVRFPIWPSRIIVAFGCLTLAAQYAISIVTAFRSKREQATGGKDY